MNNRFEPSSSGIYSTPVDLGGCREAAAAAGLAWIEIDLRGARDKRSVLDAFKRGVPLPDYFGENWDALADCLQDLPQAAEGGCVLHLVGDGRWGDSTETLLEILEDSAMYWSSKGRTFVVFGALSGRPDWP